MNNPMLLSTLLAEFYAECCEKTMRFDDLDAIKRTMELVSYDFPMEDIGEEE